MKNYNLIRIVEKLEIRKSQISHSGKSFAGKTTDANIESTNLLTIKDKDNLDENKNPDKKKTDKLPTKKLDKSDKSDKIEIVEVESGKNLDYNYNEPCPKHGLQIHSYAVGTKLLFCDKCLTETKLKTSPLPSVIDKNYL